MATITLEPLRWLEEPSRITIRQNGENHRSYYQVTAPRDISAMCIGRHAEELPRILSILSPTHHIVSAIALDNLFGVTPPPLAQNVREALAQSHVFKHHLRKLFFLVSSFDSPIAQHQGSRSRTEQPLVPHHVLHEIMHGVALSQEAASILGGRCDHPLTAVAGGVSRFLKESHYSRLAEIAESYLRYALNLREFLHRNIFGSGNVLEELTSHPPCPMASIAFNATENAVVLTGTSGSETERFSPGKTPGMLETLSEPWTYLPFVHLRGKGWEGPLSSETSGLYFVGPLARMNQGKPAETPHAEEERQHLLGSLGAFPHFSVMAAYRSLVVELIQAAERMKNLCTEERLTGSEIRIIPSHLGQTGYAAFEGPEGFVYHQYEVDERGIVEGVTILDAAAENNALRCLLTRTIVDEAVTHGKPWNEAKNTIELSLMPF